MTEGYFILKIILEISQNKEFPERLIGSFKSTMYLSLYVGIKINVGQI